MSPKHKRPSQPVEPSPTGERPALAEALHEFELPSANHRLSDVERKAIQQGSDAAKFGSFAPEDEMAEFYRLHRDV